MPIMLLEDITLILMRLFERFLYYLYDQNINANKGNFNDDLKR